MNDYKRELLVKKQNDKKEDKLKGFNKKVAIAILDAIDNIEVDTYEEKLMKVEYIMNLTKIINNYEDLRGILTKYFEGKSKDEIEK